MHGASRPHHALRAPPAAAGAEAPRTASRQVVLEGAVYASRIEVHREADLTVRPRAVRFGCKRLCGIYRRGVGVGAEDAREEQDELQRRLHDFQSDGNESGPGYGNGVAG